MVQLNVYQHSQVEITTKSLPRKVDIANGVKSVRAGRGSVKKMDFSIITTRRVLLRSRDVAGNHLPKGGGAFTQPNEFVITVLDNGRIFLNNSQLSDWQIVRLDEREHCQSDYAMPDKADPDVYIESGDAV